ncbi:MAG: tetratricopeptide repeat protein [Prolixibacteraceae bacterium]|nr:tetratricopeptide repeat protein [Prolixibacteraceae bacterium]HQH75462.1 tetratricopeptide repeat protein [Prolixibacteraceae bacterium]
MKKCPSHRGILTQLLLLFAISSPAQLNINHYMRVGQTRISIGNYVGAIEYFNIVIKFKPHMPEPYFFRGVAKHKLEDFQGAILDYEKAIGIKPFYPDAYSYRGLAYHQLGNFGKAIEDYNKALELDPKNEGVYINRGIARISGKDVDGAIGDYEKALEVNPSSTGALMNRSNAKIIKGDTRGAIQDLNQVITIRPHYASAYLNRGIARFELNDFASALRDYDQCIRLEPGNALAYNNRGIVKHKLEDYNGAIMDYDMAIRLDPGMANAYFNRAMAREILKRPGYESDYQIAGDLNPQYDLSRFTLSAEQLAQQQQQAKQPSPGTPPSDNGKEENEEGGIAAENNINTEKEREEETRRRRRLNLILSDTRNLPVEKIVNPDDPHVQNRSIVIDLQPIFLISALEKNSVNYERLQYFNQDIESLNKENNYNPLLTFTNKTNDGYQNLFQNYILFFNEKIAVSPGSTNYLNRGIFHCLAGNYTQALTDLDIAVRLDSASVLAYMTRGSCRYRMTEHFEMLMDFPSQMPVREQNYAEGKGESETQVTVMSDYDLILKDFDRAIGLRPDLFFGYYNRAFIHLKQKNYETAMADLDKAIELEPEFAEAYYNRGLTLIFLDEPARGALDLSKAGELGLVEAYSIIKRYCN